MWEVEEGEWGGRTRVDVRETADCAGDLLQLKLNWSPLPCVDVCLSFLMKKKMFLCFYKETHTSYKRRNIQVSS